MSACAFSGCGHAQTEHTDHFCWHDGCNAEHRYADPDLVAYPDEPRPTAARSVLGRGGVGAQPVSARNVTKA